MRENKGEIERVSFLPESSLAGVFYSVSVHVGVSLDVAERQMARIAAVDGCMRVGRQELRKRASERASASSCWHNSRLHVMSCVSPPAHCPRGSQTLRIYGDKKQMLMHVDS